MDKHGGMSGCVLPFLNYCITFVQQPSETQGLPHLEGPSPVEKEDSVSPFFLVLAITDKALEAVSTADWEAHQYRFS